MKGAKISDADVEDISTKVQNFVNSINYPSQWKDEGFEISGTGEVRTFISRISRLHADPWTFSRLTYRKSLDIRLLMKL